jgi:hypothetical protein
MTTSSFWQMADVFAMRESSLRLPLFLQSKTSVAGAKGKIFWTFEQGYFYNH